MTVTSGAQTNEYFLIPRDPEGEYVNVAEGIALQQGASGFSQSIRPGAGVASDAERIMLLELQNLLPKNVHLTSESPFLTLRIASSGEGNDTTPLARCECRCGGSYSCGGGGGGAC